MMIEMIGTSTMFRSWWSYLGFVGSIGTSEIVVDSAVEAFLFFILKQVKRGSSRSQKLAIPFL